MRARCDTKCLYRSYAAAHAVVLQMRKTVIDPFHLEAYWCERHLGWHVGNNIKRTQGESDIERADRLRRLDMSTWRYAPIDEQCGSCNRPIKAGDIELLVQFPFGDRVRCKTCGGQYTHETPPEVLPDLEHQPAAPAKPAGFASMGELARAVRERGRR